ncbi:MAG: hypothetical protein IH963_05710, partial [Chloroflexi bacterium]|nr:hypothetical protein [Chloroflexota bacterium]
ADVTFAHRTLAKFCDEESIPYQPFVDFKGLLLAVREYAKNGRDGTIHGTDRATGLARSGRRRVGGRQ